MYHTPLGKKRENNASATRRRANSLRAASIAARACKSRSSHSRAQLVNPSGFRGCSSAAAAAVAVYEDLEDIARVNASIKLDFV